VVVLVAGDDPAVDGAQDLGRDRVLVVGDVVCERSRRSGTSEQDETGQNDEERLHAQLATSFWIWVGVSIQHTAVGDRSRQ